MKKFVLENGLRVVFEKKPAKSVAIEITVKSGSNDEANKINGISHFIEHMVFEGTKKRKTNREIANEIEKLGGELNAYTSNERTCFFAKVLNKHLDKALEVLSDIIQNPLFEKKSIDRERKVILKEINMVKDEPRFHQWILFQKALFKRFPAKNPPYGTVKAVKSLKRKDLLNYYKKYYIPNNMIVSIAGGVRNPIPAIKRYFNNFKRKTLTKKKKIAEPKQRNASKSVEKRNILSSYMVLGYKTVARKEKDSYALDIIKAILGRGQSGKLFIEIRNKRGLAYEVGVNNEANINYGYFAVYLNTDKKNIPLVVKLILEEFQKLKSITNEELKEAKDYLEGEYILHNEDNFHLADELNFWQMNGDSNLINSYVKNIRKIRKEDVVRAVNRDFTKNYCLAEMFPYFRE